VVVHEAAEPDRTPDPADRRLVAYLVGEPPGDAELQLALAQALPRYMVPATFVRLEALPRTAHGKLDHRALPAPEAKAESERGYLPPSNNTERLLAEIFAEVLGVERVGVLDNFFELGGHSLLATRLMTRIRNTFHVEVPLRDFFTSPTVGRLAVVIGDLILAELEQLSDEEIERLSEEI